MKMLRIAKILLVIALTYPTLGCVDAAMTGAQVAYNHDHIQKTLSDQYITTQANRKLFRDTYKFQDSNVSISTFHQEVLLTGQVKSSQQRQEITEIISHIPDVKKVYNFTQISRPVAGLTQVSDSWITSKIKAKLIASNDIDPNQIKVVTENGMVFLMGTVLVDQAETAVDISRDTAGVQGVVKLFKYLRISEK